MIFSAVLVVSLAVVVAASMAALQVSIFRGKTHIRIARSIFFRLLKPSLCTAVLSIVLVHALSECCVLLFSGVYADYRHDGRRSPYEGGGGGYPPYGGGGGDYSPYDNRGGGGGGYPSYDNRGGYPPYPGGGGQPTIGFNVGGLHTIIVCAPNFAFYLVTVS